MRLLLVRHGQTAWNAELRAQGHSDIPLDELGLSQAEALGAAMALVEPCRILTSDLRRAKQTAEPIARSWGTEALEESRLRERSFGDWEGLLFSKIHEQMAGHDDPFGVRPPNGESFRDVWNRLDPIVEQLQDAEDDHLVVTHGGACGLLLAKLVRGSVETSRSFRFGNTGVTELQRRPDGWFTIVRYNDTSHLEAVPLGGDVDGARR